jgi:uncharacterized membrane protein
MARHPRWTRRLFSPDDLEAIARAIAGAEAQTSGEIRVHLERRIPRHLGGKPPAALERAREVFGRLGMHRTAERNGVLIYLALEDRRLAIVGDDGVHARVGDAYWERVRDLMVERLGSEAPRAAVVEAIHEVVSVLSQHFPRRPDDRNELSDQVSVE